MDFERLQKVAIHTLSRFLIRPALLVFINPNRLTESLKHNVATKDVYEPYQNVFVPFQSSRFQHLSFISFSRSISGLYRVSKATQALVSGDEERLNEVNVIGAGHVLGDFLELLLLRERYGRGSGWSIVSFFLNATLLYVHSNRSLDPRLGALLQAVHGALDCLPLWYLRFSHSSYYSAADFGVVFVAALLLWTLGPRATSGIKEGKGMVAIGTGVLGLALALKLRNLTQQQQ